MASFSLWPLHQDLTVDIMQSFQFISRAGRVSEILLLIPSIILDHGVPLIIARKEQNAPESNKVI